MYRRYETARDCRPLARMEQAKSVRRDSPAFTHIHSFSTSTKTPQFRAAPSICAAYLHMFRGEEQFLHRIHTTGPEEKLAIVNFFSRGDRIHKDPEDRSPGSGGRSRPESCWPQDAPRTACRVDSSRAGFLPCQSAEACCAGQSRLLRWTDLRSWPSGCA